MRLKVSAAAANDALIAFINEGYNVLEGIRHDYYSKKKAGTFDDEKDNRPYWETLNTWARKVEAGLREVFPTELEVNTFLNPQIPFGAVGGDYQFESFRIKALAFIRGLDKIRQDRVPEYTDLPLGARLFVEDIESFQKVRDVNPALVGDVLKDGYLDMLEDEIQLALEQILNEPMHKRDWGGEGNDLYTANLMMQGQRIPTAFVLKGRGLNKPTLEIGDCGKNGDQLVRLMDSPARLFIVQYVGNIAEAVIKDLEGKVRAARAGGREAWYCIMNGQDTARLLKAYGKI